MSLKREEKRKKKEQEKKKRKVQTIARKSVASHFEEAEMAYQMGNKEAVVYHLKKILQVKPNDMDALRWLAEVQFNLKHYQEAAHYIERLKQEGDDWIFLNFYAGLAYYYSKTHLDRSFQNLRVFLDKTKRRKGKDILEKRQVALYYADLVQHLLPLQSALQPQSKSAGQAVVQRTRPLKERARAGSSEEVTGEKAGRKEVPPVAAQKPPIIEAGNFQIHITYSFSSPAPILNSIRENRVESKSRFDLRLEYHHLSLLRGYDELLCLDTLRHVDHYWYQIETARRVLKYYRGRVLLADEVGLGKTIEACMLIKEYLLRGLIRRVLVLTPTSLVSQWHEELSSKFGLDFATTDQEEFRQNGSFWSEHPLIVASLNVAKSKKNFEKITHLEHDLVVVDEAHHLRNRTTLNWKLVNALKRKFVILISATPVQNNLIELFNLITLLKPGFLKTEREVRQRYVASGKPKMPKN
ncbi:MAG: SNF2-related protein, partial [bacterium]